MKEYKSCIKLIIIESKVCFQTSPVTSEWQKHKTEVGCWKFDEPKTIRIFKTLIYTHGDNNEFLHPFENPSIKGDDIHLVSPKYRHVNHGQSASSGQGGASLQETFESSPGPAQWCLCWWWGGVGSEQEQRLDLQQTRIFVKDPDHLRQPGDRGHERGQVGRQGPGEEAAGGQEEGIIRWLLMWLLSLLRL